MCNSEVEMKVWMRGRSASFTASAARTMSPGAARASPQITGPRTVLRNLLHALEVVVGGDGEASLDNIDAEFRRASAMRSFSEKRHGEAGGLLSVSEGSVEDDDAVVGDRAEVGVVDGHGCGLRKEV